MPAHTLEQGTCLKKPCGRFCRKSALDSFSSNLVAIDIKMPVIQRIAQLRPSGTGWTRMWLDGMELHTPAPRSSSRVTQTQQGNRNATAHQSAKTSSQHGAGTRRKRGSGSVIHRSASTCQGSALLPNLMLPKACKCFQNLPAGLSTVALNRYLDRLRFC